MGTFIDLEELAAFLSPRAPRDLSGDVLAQVAIEAACGAIRTTTEQELDLVEDDTASFLCGEGRRELILPQMPVLSIEAVRLDQEPITDWILTGAGILRRTSTNGTVPVWIAGVVEVDYSHGFDPMPAELRLLALTLAGRAYQQGTARQESTGSSSITYSVAASLDLTTGERALLAKYRHPKAALLAQAGP